jgi:hypothetical protein
MLYVENFSRKDYNFTYVSRKVGSVGPVRTNQI